VRPDSTCSYVGRCRGLLLQPRDSKDVTVLPPAAKESLVTSMAGLNILPQGSCYRDELLHLLDCQEAGDSHKATDLPRRLVLP
jgi:hypothetical protein